ncbi:MAG: lysylphosphatidylglycerol synthase transmembrane domain-containing protein [Melioribacteraceae bacterium]|jgi:uncharacterized protein (TIRG00374 family)|nr:lysylphosphatidylglycerol synthase transmembrane domain-containing protein [Melioribacteraceae bacterium]
MSRKAKIILFAVGVAIFIYLVNDFGLNNILINLKKTGWYFIPVFGVWAFVYLCNAFAWRFVIGNDSKKISFGKILSITISGFAINYITPSISLGGEPYRVAELRKPLGISKAVSSTFLYSMIHFLSSFVFWILIILLALVSLTITSATKISLIVTLIVFFVIVYFFINRHKNGILESLLNITAKIPFIKKLASKYSDKIEPIKKIDEQIKDLYLNRKSDFFSALSLEILARIIASLENLFILKAIGIDITFSQALYINAFSSFVINLFFFMPLELGSREGGLVLVLKTLRISSSLGIYIGLVNRIRELLWILIGLILIISGKKKPTKELTAKEKEYEKSAIV